MLLPYDQAMRFVEGYKAVLLRVLADTRTPLTESIEQDLINARALADADPQLVSAALDGLAAENAAVEPTVVAAIGTLRLGQWIYLRHGKTFAVFLDKSNQNAYAVRALTTPLDELVDAPPFLLETGLLEFEGHFICDGLVRDPIRLGSGYRSQLNAAYTRIRQQGNFHARPAEARTSPPDVERMRPSR